MRNFGMLGIECKIKLRRAILNTCASLLIFLHCIHILRFYLKVLSSEMDPAEIKLIQTVVIKERGKSIFKKNSPAPHHLRAL
jgi:hypothetical protein